MAQLTVSARTRSFHVHSILRWLGMPALACAVILAIIVAVSEPEDRVILPWMILIMAIALGFAALMIYLIRLEVSPEGILYTFPGMRVRSTWDNIEGYAFRTMNTRSVTVLALRKPGLEISGWLKPFLGIQTAMPTVKGSLTRRGLAELASGIPVSMFAADWREGELGQLIRQYAPAAFDNLVS